LPSPCLPACRRPLPAGAGVLFAPSAASRLVFLVFFAVSLRFFGRVFHSFGGFLLVSFGFLLVVFRAVVWFSVVFVVSLLCFRAVVVVCLCLFPVRLSPCLLVFFLSFFAPASSPPPPAVSPLPPWFALAVASLRGALVLARPRFLSGAASSFRRARPASRFAAPRGFPASCLLCHLSRAPPGACGVFLVPLPLSFFAVSFSPAPFLSFGFGGARAGSPACLAACAAFLRRVPAGSAVFVSCASGASAVVRAAFPAASVFSASSPAFAGLGSAAFAARAAALVRALAASPSPLFVCFPGRACPPPLLPSRSWRGGGSGSWSECALAFGLGVPVLVFLPAGVLPPGSWGSWRVLGGGWFFLPAAPSLFS